MMDMHHRHGSDHSHGGYSRGGRGGAPRPSVSRQEAQRRFKESVSGHRTGLPKKLLDLFAPRPGLPFLPPIQKKKPKLPYTGVAQYLEHFSEPGDADYEPPRAENRPKSPREFRNPELAVQARIDLESRAEKKIRLREQKIAAAKEEIEESLKSWDPHKDPKIEGDPFKTLFVSRISFEVTEKNLKREFEKFGSIKRIRLVFDTKTGKPRGYAFIEYEHKRDMTDAYKMAEGMKIEGRRVLVDVERGRTIDNWRPRRLGGGLGGQSRAAREPGTRERENGFRPSEPVERERRSERVERDRREFDRPGGEFRDRFRERERFERPQFDRSRDFRDRDRERGGRTERPHGEMRGSRGMREHGRDRERERDRMERGRHNDRDRERRERKRSRGSRERGGDDREGKRVRHLEDGELDNREHHPRRRERDM